MKEWIFFVYFIELLLRPNIEWLLNIIDLWGVDVEDYWWRTLSSIVYSEFHLVLKVLSWLAWKKGLVNMAAKKGFMYRASSKVFYALYCFLSYRARRIRGWWPGSRRRSSSGCQQRDCTWKWERCNGRFSLNKYPLTGAVPWCLWLERARGVCQLRAWWGRRWASCLKEF